MQNFRTLGQPLLKKRRREKLEKERGEKKFH
jgi:hypothetical protein